MCGRLFTMCLRFIATTWGQAVPAVIQCDSTSIATVEGARTMQALSGSASMLSGRVILTRTDVSVDTAVATQIGLKNGDIVEGTVSVLTHPQITAGKSFDHWDEAHPTDVRVSTRGKLELYQCLRGRWSPCVCESVEGLSWYEALVCQGVLKMAPGKELS